MSLNKTSIEWVVNNDGTNGFTWNPIVGCLYSCPYCYARKIANRFRPKLPQGDDCSQPENGMHVIQGNSPFRYGFEPTLHLSRLPEPQKRRQSSTIFVGSMADIFGRWIPPEWIKQILESAYRCPQHTFLFLTKNGSRMREEGNVLDTKNAWYGQTCTGIPDRPIFDIPNGRHFLSFEPLLGDWIPDLRCLHVNWIIIGSLNRNGRAVHPNSGGTKKEWVLKVVTEAKKLRIPLFIKSELLSLYPDLPQIKDAPYMDYWDGIIAKRLTNIEVENDTVRETWAGINRENRMILEFPLRQYPLENTRRSGKLIIDKLFNTDAPPPSLEEKGRLKNCLMVMDNILQQEHIRYCHAIIGTPPDW